MRQDPLLAKALKDMRVVMAELRRVSARMNPDKATREAERQVNAMGMMEQIVGKRFARESTRSVGGSKWARLKPSTVARRGSAHPILDDTGSMRELAIMAVEGSYSIVGPIGWDGLADVAGIGAWHQYGTDRMPARPFLLDPNKAELAPADRMAGRMLDEWFKRATA
jgi:hypothetical protein